MNSDTETQKRALITSLRQNIVVLTATIDPSVGKVHVALSNKVLRLTQYLDNIRRLILESDFTHIIFCENSNYHHDYSDLTALAQNYGKKLEILSFMGSNDIIMVKGKGYGEGEILNYAVNNSMFLQENCTTFYKLTGRIYVENVNTILAHSNNDNIFIRWDVKKNEVDTRFFKTQVGFFKENLSHLLDRCDERTAMSIEEVYFDVLKGTPEVYSFTSYPIIKGMCASLGRPYDLGLLKLTYRIIQLKTGLLDLRRLK